MKKSIATFCTLWLFLLFAGAPQPIRAETTATRANPAPIQIEADRMESKQQKDTVQFTGNVVAIQDDLTIHADQMIVVYLTTGDNPKKAGASRKIKKLVAKGHVKIIKEGWTATGDDMEYLPIPKKVILTGNAQVWQDKNMVTGDSITLFLDEGRSIIKKGAGQSKRVKAFIYPGVKSDKQQ